VRVHHCRACLLLYLILLSWQAATRRPTSSTIIRLQPPRQEQLGRLERKFVEVGEVEGQFGKVIKVQRKADDDSAVYAIKKSKRFEGIRHRSEVEVLKYLSQVVQPQPEVIVIPTAGRKRYCISKQNWESGNLAQFLGEYRRAFLSKAGYGRLLWTSVV